MPVRPSPAFHFANQASLVKFAAAASATVTATLDSLQGVNQVAWEVVSTDDTTDASSYPLTISGPKGNICQFTAGVAGTALMLKATVNNGVNLVTDNADVRATRAQAKAFVPVGGGALEVGCFNEAFESGATGWLAQHNAAIRYSAGLTGILAPTPDTVPLRDGTGQLFMIGLDAGAGDLVHLGNLTLDASIVAPAITQSILAGMGANAGQNLTISAQPGQAQTGGAANNNGGDALWSGGDPGTGGGGAAGHRGRVVLTGGDVIMSAGTSLAVPVTITGQMILNSTAAMSFNVASSLKFKLDSTGIGEYGHATTGQGPAITQTYATTGTTLNPASTSAFAGINNAQGGTPYAKLTDLEQLRQDLLQALGVLNATLDYFQARGTLQ